MDIASSSVTSALTHVGLGGFSIDIIAIFVVWLMLFAFGFAMGISRLSAIALVAIAVTLFLQYAPHAWLVGSLLSTLPIAIHLLVFFGISFFIFLRLCDPGFVDGGGIVSAALSALSVTTVLLALWAAAFSNVREFPALLAPYFTGTFTLWWLVGSLAVLAIMRQRI